MVQFNSHNTEIFDLLKIIHGLMENETQPELWLQLIFLFLLFACYLLYGQIHKEIMNAR